MVKNLKYGSINRLPNSSPLLLLQEALQPYYMYRHTTTYLSLKISGLQEPLSIAHGTINRVDSKTSMISAPSSGNSSSMGSRSKLYNNLMAEGPCHTEKRLLRTLSCLEPVVKPLIVEPQFKLPTLKQKKNK